ncbi:iron uptake porin [Pleurocapsa sp. PCC 7319]|uniref:iron uptake porin n=1 Tax=Pleurocapsa sp. PCC 7319 TaxID=118161 RepID=UPI0003482DB9|nr:iron uptake porin [Pleurocapsa sp. PCC 7319]
MSNLLINLLPTGVIACGVILWECSNSSASPSHNYQNDLGQVTNVNQLRDVAPTDWAYEALRSLVDRYGCISGFPNQTYKGSQPLSRYEFAAGLNSCLNQMERLIASSESVSEEDLATIQRLNQKFKTELASLGGRVDEIEGRTTVLEDSSFSTTTKLNGEIVNYVLGTFGDEKPDGSDIDDEITFSSRIRLNFDSSFTGEDRLRVRLQARNVTSPASSGGNNALALNFEGDNNNNVEIDDLHYIFPITDKISALVGANGVAVDDFFNVVPTMGVAYDALSLYSAYNNLIYDNANGEGAAVGIDIDIIDSVNLAVGYWATNPAEPEPGNGLFNGNYAAGANLNISLLEERLNFALAYLRAYQGAGSGYDLAGFVGTDAATDPFEDRANSSNNYGFASSFQVLERLSIGGYFGYTTASTIDDNADASILTWNAYATYSDLLKEGSAFIVSFGQSPSLIDSDGNALENDEDEPYLLNVEFQYSLNDFIQFTPGGYALFNPNGNSDNETIYVGTLRTIFRF